MADGDVCWVIQLFYYKECIELDILRINTKKAHFKHLSAAFYSIVSVVGQFPRTEGTAALAVDPIWIIIYSIGQLIGIGGSIIFWR